MNASEYLKSQKHLIPHVTLHYDAIFVRLFVIMFSSLSSKKISIFTNQNGIWLPAWIIDFICLTFVFFNAKA